MPELPQRWPASHREHRTASAGRNAWLVTASGAPTDLTSPGGALAEAALADLKQDLSRTSASWLFLSQGVTEAIVGLLVSLR